jgi:prepilin-type N-terminal cleavage/methylation domain-containing protein
MRGQAGFTILEVIIVAVILTMVLLAGTDVLGTTGAAFGTGISITSLEAKANRLLDRIVAELRQAGVATLDPAAPAGSPSITYRRGAGYENGVALWGPSRRIELRPDEVQDGVDNDSDGVVDEHDIVWVADPGLPTERTVLWAHGVRPRLEGEEPNGADDNGNGLVDEPGLCFRLRDETLIVELTVEGRDPKGRLFVRTATSAVRLRN